jgi:hypothetical protein
MQEDIPGFDKECSTCSRNACIIEDKQAIEIIYLFNVLCEQLRVAGMTGYPLALDYNSVEFVFDLYEVKKEYRKFYFEWLVKLTNELIIYPMRIKLLKQAE